MLKIINPPYLMIKSHVKRLKKSAFTLFELLIVLFIISIGAVLAGVQMHKMIKEQRFLSEVDQLVNQLLLAQDLMLIMDTDVTIKLIEEDRLKSIRYEFEVEKPLKGYWEKVFKNKPEPFKSIRKIKFRGVEEVLDPDEKDFDGVFLRFSLGMMSRGILTLSPFAEQEGTEQEHRSQDRAILLTGYPRVFKAQTMNQMRKDEQLLNQQQLIQESRDLYPTEIQKQSNG